MATVLAAVWNLGGGSRQTLVGMQVLLEGKHSRIYTFPNTSSVFKTFPYWSNADNWVVCRDLEHFLKVWEEEGLVRAFSGKIPMPTYYEIEEFFSGQ